MDKANALLKAGGGKAAGLPAADQKKIHAALQAALEKLATVKKSQDELAKALGGELTTQPPEARDSGVPGIAAPAARVTVKDSKWDYFFGRVKSNPHNETRSLQNLKDLEALGIKEAQGGREQLMKLFDQGLSAPEVMRIEVPGGTTIVRLVKVEGKGYIEINYFYKGSDLNLTPEISNIIPKPSK